MIAREELAAPLSPAPLCAHILILCTREYLSIVTATDGVKLELNKDWDEFDSTIKRHQSCRLRTKKMLISAGWIDWTRCKSLFALLPCSVIHHLSPSFSKIFYFHG
jgi:hypothetical protein